MATATEPAASSTRGTTQDKWWLNSPALRRDLIDNLFQFILDVMVAHSKSPSREEICAEMVFAKIMKYEEVLNDPELLKHKQIFNMLMRDKEGNAREHDFLGWCRKVAEIRRVNKLYRKHCETDAEMEEKDSYAYKIEDADAASHRRLLQFRDRQI